MCFGQKVNTQQQQNKNEKKALPETRINPGSLAPKANALPLLHRVN